MLCFSNPGELDILAMATLGVNVKEGSSPIGFFGTGLKYAIAASLRLGFDLEIQSGLRCFRFETKIETIRGKPFEIIWLYEPAGGESQRLGFTTEYGKTWEPWMIYRELWSNCMDEQGDIALATSIGTPRVGETKIFISGLDQVHVTRSEFILQTQPIYSNEFLEIHRGSGSSAVFYRGLKVGHFDRPTLFRYNVLSEIALTEDRTAKEVYYLKNIIAMNTIRIMTEPGDIQRLAFAPERFIEESLDYDWSNACEEFQEQVLHLAQTQSSRLQSSLMALAKRLSPELAEPTELELNHIESEQLSRAMLFLQNLGYDITAPVKTVKSLGDWNIGRAENGVIYLAKAAFDKGTKYVASTLLEEQVHIDYGYRDESRELQDWLFDQVVSLGERINGEPL